MFRTSTVDTCNSRAIEEASLKPGVFTVRVYVLAGSSGATYSPSAFVFTVRIDPVPSLRTITATLGTTAPVGSETTPRIVPVVFWASSGARSKVTMQNPDAKCALQRFMDDFHFRRLVCRNRNPTASPRRERRIPGYSDRG